MAFYVERINKDFSLSGKTELPFREIDSDGQTVY